MAKQKRNSFIIMSNLFKTDKKNKIVSMEKEEVVQQNHEVNEPENKTDFVIIKGDTGKKVKMIQFAIGVNVDGIYGDKTQSAIDIFRQQTGFKNKHVISAMEYDSIISNVNDLKHIKIARSYVGKVEEQDIDGDGNPDNRSPEIDKMTKYVFEWFNENDKNAEGYPWCAIFISYIMKCAYSSWKYKSASVKDWMEMMENSMKSGDVKELTKTSQVRKDSVYIGCWVNSNGLGHIFFVDPFKTMLLNDHRILSTIEGNTNDGGSREGNGVYERQRYFTENNKIRLFGIKV